MRRRTPRLTVTVPAVSKVLAHFDAVRPAAVRAVDRANHAAQAGMASTAEWMAATAGEKHGRARGDVVVAGSLAGLAEVAGALAHGKVSKTRVARYSD